MEKERGNMGGHEFAASKNDRSMVTRVNKLALAYKTGWQYRPDSEEAGSVLTDIFMEMEKENRRRFKKIWEKHKLEFLSIVPEEKREAVPLKTAVTVRAAGEMDGRWLAAGTGVYTVPEEGGIIRFRTLSSVLLTAAGLCCAVYQNGFHAWLSYEGGKGEDLPLRLFAPAGEKLAAPEFCWYFPGLCDGREAFCFSVRFHTERVFPPLPAGRWSISDGKECCPVECRQEGGKFFLCGENTGFAGNLEAAVYELRLCMEEEPGEEWLDALYGGFALEEAGGTAGPELCFTDAGGCGAQRVLPFGRALDKASCCYFVCDRAAAGRSGEISLCFTERFEQEESLPEAQPKEYEKLYKKYPWLRQTQTVLEWKAEETVWEYFNGSIWCVLPGSGEWRTGCGTEQAGERVYKWEKPRDMQPCVVEGEEHFFIRLRLESVQNAYAAYYRKYIPVLEEVRFLVEERRVEPVGRRLPERTWAGKRKMYLGFDRGITPDNCWYTGEGALFFRQDQIRGQGRRFGREAFWVELEAGEERLLEHFLPNYIPILQITEEEADDTPKKIPAAAVFNIETQDFGVLEAASVSDAVSVSDMVSVPDTASVSDTVSSTDTISSKDTVSSKDTDRFMAGVRRRREPEKEGNYFSHYGRLVTQMDLDLLVREHFPLFRVVSCTLREDSRELDVAVEAVGAEETRSLQKSADNQRMLAARECREEERARKNIGAALEQLREWLPAVISRMGGLWLQGASVNCRLFLGGEDEEVEKKECQNGYR